MAERKQLSPEEVRANLDRLPPGYKTGDLDALIARYCRERADVSALRELVLTEQRFHRIYFYVSLKQIRSAEERMDFIHRNLLFSDWWHTDELIRFVQKLDFDTALSYARAYQRDPDPFIRRWGYVLFIGKLGKGRAQTLLPLIRDDEHYYVRMGEAWLIAELAIWEPEKVFSWLAGNGLRYDVNGKAIQKICDSFRIPEEWKERFKTLRPSLKAGQN